MKQARCTKHRMFFMGHAFAITCIQYEWSCHIVQDIEVFCRSKGGARDQVKVVKVVLLVCCGCSSPQVYDTKTEETDEISKFTN